MVNTPIRTGVLGTHSTGKTTLLKRIETELRGRGIAVARTGRLAERAAGIGLPKMQHHTVLSTEWIITQGVADEIAAAAQGAEVVLADDPLPHVRVTSDPANQAHAIERAVQLCRQETAV